MDAHAEARPVGATRGALGSAYPLDPVWRQVGGQRNQVGLRAGGERRRRAMIQLASSLRNLGRPEESVALLTTELDAGSDHLDDAVRAFLALALTDVGREREAASHSCSRQ